MRKTIPLLITTLCCLIFSGYAFLGNSTPANAYDDDDQEVVTVARTMKATPAKIALCEYEYEIPDLASDYDVELIARTIWGEAEVVNSKAEQAAVAWCVLNRVDAHGKSIEQTVLAPYQFAPRLKGDVPEYFIELAADVVDRWEREHAGFEDVGRTLPADYEFFVGDGRHNHFSIEWKSKDYWDWSLPDPYTQE